MRGTKRRLTFHPVLLLTNTVRMIAVMDISASTVAVSINCDQVLHLSSQHRRQLTSEPDINVIFEYPVAWVGGATQLIPPVMFPSSAGEARMTICVVRT
jgi:hypothetical protein